VWKWRRKSIGKGIGEGAEEGHRLLLHGHRCPIDNVLGDTIWAPAIREEGGAGGQDLASCSVLASNINIKNQVRVPYGNVAYPYSVSNSPMQDKNFNITLQRLRTHWSVQRCLTAPFTSFSPAPCLSLPPIGIVPGPALHRLGIREFETFHRLRAVCTATTASWPYEYCPYATDVGPASGLETPSFEWEWIPARQFLPHYLAPLSERQLRYRPTRRRSETKHGISQSYLLFVHLKRHIIHPPLIITLARLCTTLNHTEGSA
jgi:hypothetical protein